MNDDYVAAVAEAGERAAARAAVTNPDFDAISKAAGEDLERLTREYQRSLRAAEPGSAQSQLEAFINDPGAAKGISSGRPGHLKRLAELTEAVANSDGTDRVKEMLVAGTAPEHHGEFTSKGVPMGQQLNLVDEMRQAGLSDGVIVEAFTAVNVETGQKIDYSPELIARTKAYRSKCMGDPAWTTALLNGEYGPKRELALISIILANAS